MLKKLLLGLCVFVATPVFAEEDTTTPPPQQQTESYYLIKSHCYTTESVNRVLKELEQKLIWVAVRENGVLMLFRKDDGSWFMLMTPKDRPELTCKIFNGESSDTYLPPPPVENHS